MHDESIAISQITVRIYGGRSPVEEVGISIAEYHDEIIIRAFEKYYREGSPDEFDRSGTLPKWEYESLWKELDTLRIWKLKDASDAEMSDLFTHEFVFQKEGKENKFSVYGLSTMKPYVEIEKLIRTLAARKLGVWQKPNETS
ncbi:MAG: hypothetical protein HY447_02335 [Candidatus Omnitrophica bacterium]|nr:hypothetical protein [Candidatus Omnitrophota bacterium]